MEQQPPNVQEMWGPVPTSYHTEVIAMGNMNVIVFELKTPDTKMKTFWGADDVGLMIRDLKNAMRAARTGLILPSTNGQSEGGVVDLAALRDAKADEQDRDDAEE